jgi:hypothetical protein
MSKETRALSPSEILMVKSYPLGSLYFFLSARTDPIVFFLDSTRTDPRLSARTDPRVFLLELG